MQSEAASESSPETGPDKGKSKSKRAQDDGAKSAGKNSPGKRKGSRKRAALDIVFDSQRYRHLGWALFHISFGLLLVLKLGTVAQGIGVFFLVLGGLRAIKFVRRIGGPEAALTVSETEVHLPKRLTTRRSDRQTVGFDRVANVFYLRRSIPWFRISPILVVETLGEGSAAGEVYRYPRDWFASDADQRRVADRLSSRIGRELPLAATEDDSDDPVEASTLSRRNLALGFFIASGALVMIGNLGLSDFLAALRIPTAAVYVGSGLCFVAGAYYLATASMLGNDSAKPGTDKSTGAS